MRLYNKDSGEFLGEIGEDDLDFLTAQLEEESGEDTDYYINQDTLDLLRTNSASAELLAVLEKAIAGKDEVEVRWERV